MRLQFTITLQIHLPNSIWNVHVSCAFFSILEWAIKLKTTSKSNEVVQYAIDTYREVITLELKIFNDFFKFFKILFHFFFIFIFFFSFKTSEFGILKTSGW